MITNNGTELERHVIGCLLKDSTHSKCREILDSISVEDFTDHERANVFHALKIMSERKLDIDPMLVDEYLKHNKVEYTGLILLFEMMKEAFSFANLGSYAKSIKESSKRRKLVSILNEALFETDEMRETSEIITSVADELKNIELNSSGRELRHLKEVEGSWLDRLEERVAAGGVIKGLKTGIDRLDESIGGIDEQSLVIIAGLPSMGKTLFAQTIATNIGIDKKENVMFFSMEMSEIQLYERFISSVGNINPNNIRSAKLNDEEYGRIENAAVNIRESGIYVTDEAKQSVGQIRAKVRRHKNKHKDLRAVFIDYLGLMKLGKADRHDIAVGNITRDLKELAKEINVPVFLLVQANRGAYGSKRPNMSNLKDSSCIEADADIILFVHRQEIIEPETDLKGITELIIAKDRHGDGNGTVYAQKINGAFIGMSENEVGAALHEESIRLNPPKKERKYGM